MLKLMLVLVFVCVNAQTTRISIEVDGGKINQDVTINRSQNIVTVSVGEVSHLPAENNYHSSINLHDYTRKMVAMKDIDSGECTIIENINETLSAVEKLLLNIKVFNYHHKLVDKQSFTKFPIKDVNLSKIFGSSIAEFCNGYNVFRGLPVPRKERRVSAKMSGHRNHHKKCGICIFCLYEVRDREELTAEAGLPDAVPAVVG